MFEATSHDPLLHTAPANSGPRLVQSALVEHCGRLASTKTLQPASQESTPSAPKTASPREKRAGCGSGSIKRVIFVFNPNILAWPQSADSSLAVWPWPTREPTPRMHPRDQQGDTGSCARD